MDKLSLRADQETLASESQSTEDLVRANSGLLSGLCVFMHALQCVSEPGEKGKCLRLSRFINQT